MPNDLHARLTDYRSYLRQIERLHKKHLFTRRLYLVEQEGVSLASIILNAPQVAKLIASTVAREAYEFQPASIRRLRADGKEREIFAYPLLDLIVHGAVASIIQEAAADHLSPRVYSYRQGLSWLGPASDFAAYVRTHRKQHLDPRERGIYVLRRDIHTYTDTIPVGQRSRLWRLLRAILLSDASSVSDYDWHLIEQVVRPEVRTQDGARYCLARGTPTGQPIATVLYNLYLIELDRELERLPGAFYARYSDDLLFAHHDIAMIRATDAIIARMLPALGLSSNTEKAQELYLNAAGRPPPEAQSVRGTSAVAYVGTRVSAEGTVSLDRKKMRRLLRDLEQRATRTAEALHGRERDYVGRTVCAVINRALDPNAALVQQRSASLVRGVVTDRRQLAQLDYWLARIVLRAVTGQTSVCAFRQVPYRKMRQDWGLVSLLHTRNTWGRRQRQWTS